MIPNIDFVLGIFAIMWNRNYKEIEDSVVQGVKHSIRKQYALIFGLLFACLVILMCILNFLLLGRFYILHKKTILKNIYNEVDQAAIDGQLDSSSFYDEFNRLSSINNVDIVVLDPDMEPVLSTGVKADRIYKRLLDYIFKGVENHAVIEVTSKYEIIMIDDKFMNLEFVELWGTLSNGYIISVRTSMESIRDSSLIANQLVVIVGGSGVLLCIIIILCVTRKITRPINDLVSISEKMTQLDFREKYSSRRGRETEIDVLGNHINQLSEALEKTISDLKSANIKLQHDIDEKTIIEERRKEFISNVSHELKTPIALIQGYAEGLRDCVNDDEESRDFYCDVIIDEADKMNKLVRNLLELDQIESGDDEVITNHFDICEVVRNCAEAMSIMCKQNDINLILPDGDSVMVWANEFKISQVINNYLSNAIHYAKGDKIVKISVENHEDRARVKVFNTGDPIPEESVDKLWSKFYKVDKARTREYGGSGIGLSIVKAIMDSTGNKYGVENFENGVEFWFEVDASSDIDM